MLTISNKDGHMKKVALILASAALVSALFAETATTTTTAAPAAKAKPAATAKASVVKGSVVSVDAIGNTIIVKTAKAEDTLSVGSAAVIKVGGKDAMLGDIASGTNVSVTYKTEDGKKVASKITEAAAVASASAKNTAKK